MPGHNDAAVEELVKILAQFKKDGWITINKHLHEEALALGILNKLVEMPYWKMQKFLQAFN